MAIIKTHFFNISFEHKDLMKMLIKMTEYQDEMFPQDSKKIANNVKGCLLYTSLWILQQLWNK